MAQIPDYFYVLMKDANGEKAPPKVPGIGISWGSTRHVQVLRGELLTPIPPRDIVQLSDGRILHNYRCWRDPNILLYSVEDNVTPMLTTSPELQLLLAIEKPFDRFAVFSDDKKLEWGDKLRKGDQVCVKLPGDNASNPTWSPALVKYAGPVDGLPGKNFGVVITDSRYLGRGYTNGWFRGGQYFKCDANCGMFVSLDKLAAELPHQVPQGAIPKPKSSQLPVGNTSAPDTPVDRPPRHKFKIKDRVVVYNKKKEPTHGTVQWVGRDVLTRTLDSTHIGIETDSSALLHDFPKALSGVSHLFQATPGCRLVVPEFLVFREELADTHNPPPLSADDLSSAAVVAREDGLTKRQLMAAQRQVLKEAEKIKKEREKANESEYPAELSEVKVALNESVNVSQQKKIMEQFEKTKQEENRKKRETYAAKTQQPTAQTGGSSTQRQNSWQADGDNTLMPNKRSSPHTPPRHIDENISKEHEQTHLRNFKSGHGSSHPRSNHGGSQSTLNQGGTQLSTDQSDHRGLSQFNAPGYPSQDNTGGTQQPHNTYRVPSNIQMAPQCSGDNNDYVNSEAVDELLRNSQHNQSNQPQPQWQSNPGSQHHYYNAGDTYQPPQQPIPQQQPAAQQPVPKARQPPGNQMPPQVQQVASVGNSNPYHLAEGSPIQLATADPNEPPRYGVIKWIGRAIGVDGQVAGIELDEYMDGCSDGTFTSTGQKFFSCPYGRGLYFPLANLRPDERLGSVSSHTRPSAVSMENPIRVPMEEQEDQTIPDATQQMFQYLGNGRGIQGHQNSCYLDSTVFGLFALSDVFDTMFLEPADQSLSSDLYRRRVAELLWKGIVNPLRKNGVVRHESVMKMRTALDELGKMEGITEKEKDPEEFLNMLFKHVLHTKPFISIRRPVGVEQEFFVQLFVEHDPNLRLPTVGHLLHRMFREQQISFEKVPSKLLLQVPRFGREFQTYKRLIPELKLKIGDLADSNRKVEGCYICGENSNFICESCQFDKQQSINYCKSCFELFHKNASFKERAEHKNKPVQAKGNEDALGDPDLLSVICIETSHYVCFTRDPRDDGEKRWIFFDSMADRQYDTYNIPRVTDCTRELNEWVYQGDRERLFNAQPRELPELVRRFTQDIYMCVYVQPDVAMYGD